MKKANKISIWKTTIGMFATMAVLIVTIISAYSSIRTQAINQAQTLYETEQKEYVTDISVHFKTACIPIIIFTYCW